MSDPEPDLTAEPAVVPEEAPAPPADDPVTESPVVVPDSPAPSDDNSHLSTSDPLPDPVVEPAPAPDPVVEPAPDPVVEPTPDPVVEPVLAPIDDVTIHLVGGVISAEVDGVTATYDYTSEDIEIDPRDVKTLQRLISEENTRQNLAQRPLYNVSTEQLLLLSRAISGELTSR